MICKGTTHNNGVKLARYMATAKEGERVVRFQLSGFAESDIREAFRSVHVMAEATRCEQPFFHVQVRNPEGEELTREQWLRVANRIESKLGLTGQPRAICLHVNEQTGHEHMHVAWSRIDGDTLTARPLPFFKERLKEVSRELEIKLDLTRVTNEREGQVKAPTRNEFEQARRLGVDIRDVRQGIRDCWDQSDNGRSFRAALADQGMALAQGDRRAFVVIDHEGGIHALGKRILDMTSGQVRDRLADLGPDELPTVGQARSLVRAQQLRTEKGPEWTRDRDEMAWQDALAKVSIEKEKIERQFAEPRPGGGTAGGRGSEPVNPFQPPRIDLPPALNRTSPDLWFEDVARNVTNDQRPHAPPENLRGAAACIWTAYNQSHDARTFAAALNENGITLAAVAKEEADRSYRENTFAKEIGRFAPSYRDGEIVAVTDRAEVYQLGLRTTGDKRPAVEKFLAPLDRASLQGIDATRNAMHDRAEQREAAAHLLSILNPVKQLEKEPRPVGRPPHQLVGQETRAPAAIGKAAEVAIGKALDLVGDVFEMFLAPTLTPEQKREGAQTTRERAADAAATIDLSQYLTERELARQRQEQEREAVRHRQRDERER